MIDTGDFKIAKNSDEAFWIDFQDKFLKEIESNKRQILMNEKLLELAEEKIKAFKALE